MSQDGSFSLSFDQHFDKLIKQFCRLCRNDNDIPLQTSLILNVQFEIQAILAGKSRAATTTTDYWNQQPTEAYINSWIYILQIAVDHHVLTSSLYDVNTTSNETESQVSEQLVILFPSIWLSYIRHRPDHAMKLFNNNTFTRLFFTLCLWSPTTGRSHQSTQSNHELILSQDRAFYKALPKSSLFYITNPYWDGERGNYDHLGLDSDDDDNNNNNGGDEYRRSTTATLTSTSSHTINTKDEHLQTDDVLSYFNFPPLILANCRVIADIISNYLWICKMCQFIPLNANLYFEKITSIWQLLHPDEPKSYTNITMGPLSHLFPSGNDSDIDLNNHSTPLDLDLNPIITNNRQQRLPDMVCNENIFLNNIRAAEYDDGESGIITPLGSDTAASTFNHPSYTPNIGNIPAPFITNHHYPDTITINRPDHRETTPTMILPLVINVCDQIPLSCPDQNNKYQNQSPNNSPSLTPVPMTPPQHSNGQYSSLISSNASCYLFSATSNSEQGDDNISIDRSTILTSIPRAPLDPKRHHQHQHRASSPSFSSQQLKTKKSFLTKLEKDINADDHDNIILPTPNPHMDINNGTNNFNTGCTSYNNPLIPTTTPTTSAIFQNRATCPLLIKSSSSDIPSTSNDQIDQTYRESVGISRYHKDNLSGTTAPHHFSIFPLPQPISHSSSSRTPPLPIQSFDCDPLLAPPTLMSTQSNDAFNSPNQTSQTNIRSLTTAPSSTVSLNSRSGEYGNPLIPQQQQQQQQLLPHPIITIGTHHRMKSSDHVIIPLHLLSLQPSPSPPNESQFIGFDEPIDDIDSGMAVNTGPTLLTQTYNSNAPNRNDRQFNFDEFATTNSNNSSGGISSPLSSKSGRTPVSSISSGIVSFSPYPYPHQPSLDTSMLLSQHCAGGLFNQPSGDSSCNNSCNHSTNSSTVSSYFYHPRSSGSGYMTPFSYSGVNSERDDDFLDREELAFTLTKNLAHALAELTTMRDKYRSIHAYPFKSVVNNRKQSDTGPIVDINQLNLGNETGINRRGDNNNPTLQTMSGNIPLIHSLVDILAVPSSTFDQNCNIEADANNNNSSVLNDDFKSYQHWFENSKTTTLQALSLHLPTLFDSKTGICSLSGYSSSWSMIKPIIESIITPLNISQPRDLNLIWPLLLHTPLNQSKNLPSAGPFCSDRSFDLASPTSPQLFTRRASLTDTSISSSQDHDRTPPVDVGVATFMLLSQLPLFATLGSESSLVELTNPDLELNGEDTKFLGDFVKELLTSTFFYRIMTTNEQSLQPLDLLDFKHNVFLPWIVTISNSLPCTQVLSTYSDPMRYNDKSVTISNVPAITTPTPHHHCHLAPSPISTIHNRDHVLGQLGLLSYLIRPRLSQEQPISSLSSTSLYSPQSSEATNPAFLNQSLSNHLHTTNSLPPALLSSPLLSSFILHDLKATYVDLFPFENNYKRLYITDPLLQQHHHQQQPPTNQPPPKRQQFQPVLVTLANTIDQALTQPVLYTTHSSLSPPQSLYPTGSPRDNDTTSSRTCRISPLQHYHNNSTCHSFPFHDKSSTIALLTLNSIFPSQQPPHIATSTPETSTKYDKKNNKRNSYNSTITTTSSTSLSPTPSTTKKLSPLPQQSIEHAYMHSLLRLLKEPTSRPARNSHNGDLPIRPNAYNNNDININHPNDNTSSLTLYENEQQELIDNKVFPILEGLCILYTHAISADIYNPNL